MKNTSLKPPQHYYWPSRAHTCTYPHAHVDTCTHVQAHACAYAHMWACVHEQVWAPEAQNNAKSLGEMHTAVLLASRVCAHMYTHTHAHAYAHAHALDFVQHVHMHMHARACVGTCMCTPTHTCTHMHRCVHALSRAEHLHMPVHVPACPCACTHAHPCVHAYTCKHVHACMHGYVHVSPRCSGSHPGMHLASSSKLLGPSVCQCVLKQQVWVKSTHQSIEPHLHPTPLHPLPSSKLLTSGRGAGGWEGVSRVCTRVLNNVITYNL